jgi:fructokinase
MRFGVDLGGTKTEILALDDNGEVRLRERVATPAASGSSPGEQRAQYNQIVMMIRDLVKSAESRLQTTGSVGVGIPGTISPATGRIKNANTICLIGQAFDRDLASALGREVRLANDANCFALSEASDGAGSDHAVVFGVIIGTGCGAGLVVNGQVLEGPNSITGEWGHNPLPWIRQNEFPGPECYCGKRACIETYLSGTGFRRDHAQATGKDLSPQEILTLAQGGDTQALASIERYEDRMARSLASVINVLDPNIVVFGGGMSNVGRIYENLPLLLKKYVFSDEVATKLAPARHGDSSGVRGAAWLWPSKQK